MPRTPNHRAASKTKRARKAPATGAAPSAEGHGPVPESMAEEHEPAEGSGGEPESERELEAAVAAEPIADEGDADLDREPVEAIAKSAVDAGEESASIARLDPLAVYLREVQRHPLLAPEETQALAEKFVTTQDPAAAARLVTANLRLVVKIAYEYRRAYKNIMDLIQEGNIGLMQAVKRYDPYRGVKLSSYAAWWIRAYILRFILNNWRLVKLGTTQAQRKLFFNLRKKRAELQALGIEPTDAEVAKQLNVPESDVAEMDVRLQASERSLDAPIGDGEGRATAKVDTMPSLVEGPETLMADSELQGMLKEKLATFRATLVGKDKELAIFDQRLVADDPLTLQELGDRFGISRERVRQLEQRLTGRLREFLREEMGDAVEVA
ncbi:MAG: RNA polymerase sigma factor RpoD/SigA [Gemmatimonadales bacterium]